MPAEAENYKLLFSLINQMEVKNIKWEQVATEIGVPSKMAAQKRWERLKKKEGLGMGGQAKISSVPATDIENEDTITPPATPKGKKRNGGQSRESGIGKAAKKIKREKRGGKVKREQSDEEIDEHLKNENGWSSDT